MPQKARPAESPLLDLASIRFVVSVGTVKALLALGVLGLVPTFGYSLEVTRGVAFHFVAVGQLFLTYASRQTWVRPPANPYLHAAVVGGVAIQFAAASLPAVSNSLAKATIPVALSAVVFVGDFLLWGSSVGRLVWRSGEAAVLR